MMGPGLQPGPGEHRVHGRLFLCMDLSASSPDAPPAVHTNAADSQLALMVIAFLFMGTVCSPQIERVLIYSCQCTPAMSTFHTAGNPFPSQVRMRYPSCCKFFRVAIIYICSVCLCSSPGAPSQQELTETQRM